MSLHGHVYDDKGTPAAGANVTITDHASGFRNRVASITTDEHGGFSASLQWGNLTIDVMKTGYVVEYVQDIQPDKDIIVHLRRAGGVRGRVSDADGRPLREAFVEVVAKSYINGALTLQSVYAGVARTDRLGAYEVSGVAPGQYYLRATSPGCETVLYPNARALSGALMVNVAAGNRGADVNFRLRRGPDLKLAGQLMDAETGAPARVTHARAVSADLVLGEWVDGIVSNGLFQCQGLGRGRYFLRFDLEGDPGKPARTVVFPFEMGDRDTDGVQLTVARRVTVSGRVATGGRPVPTHLTAYLSSTEATLRATVGSGASGEVKEDGTFEIAGVEAGDYVLNVNSGNPPQFFVKDQRLVVDGHSISGVQLRLDFSAGAVSGRAVDVEGHPIPRAVVVLQTVDRDKLGSDRYQFVYSARVDGGFTITGVVPGVYLLFAWRGNPNLVGDPELFAEATKRAARVRVDAGGTVRHDASVLESSQ